MIGPIHNPLTQPHQGPDALAAKADLQKLDAATPSNANAASSSEPAKVQQAAQQFEAIFLRQMMSALERTGSLGGGPASGTASEIYGSMMVNALAEQSSQAGGIGLAELVARALTPPAAAGPENLEVSSNTYRSSD